MFALPVEFAGTLDTPLPELFDNFLHRTLQKLRVDKETKNKHIVVFMDNASIHKHPSIY